MTACLELTEDQMVEELAGIQRLARQMFEAGRVHPYNKLEHAEACSAVTKKMNQLALSGDII